MNNGSVKRDLAKQPIGYWLNRCDQAITEAMNSRLYGYGVDRIDWQILNVVAQQGPVSIGNVVEYLQANADHATLITSIDSWCQQGYFLCPDEESDKLMLTDLGTAFHQELSEQIAAFREESFRGITEDEYETVVSVLKRIIRNVSID